MTDLRLRMEDATWDRRIWEVNGEEPRGWVFARREVPSTE